MRNDFMDDGVRLETFLRNFRIGIVHACRNCKIIFLPVHQCTIPQLIFGDVHETWLRRIKDIIYNRPQLTEKILQSVMTQLEQTTQIAEEHIPRENVVDITITELVFHAGDVIIEEGTNSCDIYQLLDSEKGLLVTKDGTEVGKISKPGEYFGELSAILKQQRTATVRSLGRSVVKVFSGDNLEVILTTYPHLAKVIIDTLAKRLIAANAIIAERGAGAGP